MGNEKAKRPSWQGTVTPLRVYKSEAPLLIIEDYCLNKRHVLIVILESSPIADLAWFVWIDEAGSVPGH